MGKVFLLDNGAYEMKAGWAAGEDGTPTKEPRRITNAVAKVKSDRRRQFIADQFSEIKDFSGLFYIMPFQKGYLCNWETQKKIWDQIFDTTFSIQPRETTIMVTEPQLNFRPTQEAMIELMFEEYEFEGLIRTTAAHLSAFNYFEERQAAGNGGGDICCVVDSGYSFTHVVPFISLRSVPKAITRLDVGGKVVTNYLKDVISYRQVNLSEETYVVNQIKEDCCYVSTDLYRDLRVAQSKDRSINSIARDYILPDFVNYMRGFILKDRSQKPEGMDPLYVNNERIQAPEILFHPTDIGIPQVGLSHCIINSIQSITNVDHQISLFDNIVLTGGNCSFPGMKQRVEQDVRSMTPVHADVQVTLPENPSTYAWRGAQKLCAHEERIKTMRVTRKEYEEAGSRRLEICHEKFQQYI